jgi:hypothetical protein
MAYVFFFFKYTETLIKNINQQTNSTGVASSLRSHQSLSYTRISQYFMEPEGSLPRQKGPATGLYSESEESSTYPRTHFSKINSMLTSHIRPQLPRGLFTYEFNTKTMYIFICAYACYMHHPCVIFNGFITFFF